MKTEFDVQLQAKDLFGFNMYQTYLGGTSGAVSILLGILILVMAGYNLTHGEVGYGLLYAAGAVVILAYNPFTLWTRAKAVMKKNEVLAGVLHFCITEESITVTQGEESAELPWESVYKLVANDRRVLIYSSRVNAYIIPREQIEEQYELLKVIAEAKLPAFRRKIS